MPTATAIDRRQDHLPASIGEGVLAALDSALASSRSPATVRAYAAAWRAWEECAARHGFAVLPATPASLAIHLAERAEAGRSVASLRLSCAAIGQAHRMAGHASPTAAPVGLTADAVAAIRGSLAVKAALQPLAARDLAIVALMACAGLRRSEAAALDWDCLERCGDGSGRLTVRRSKTDQAGEGAVVAVTAAAMRDLDRWAEAQGSGRQGSLFGLSARQIARRIAAAAKSAGLGGGYSGHSGRVGMAQAMTRAGAPAQAVMRQGRWRDAKMVARYTRAEAAGEALRYL